MGRKGAAPPAPAPATQQHASILEAVADAESLKQLLGRVGKLVRQAGSAAGTVKAVRDTRADLRTSARAGNRPVRV